MVEIRELNQFTIFRFIKFFKVNSSKYYLLRMSWYHVASSTLIHVSENTFKGTISQKCETQKKKENN